MLKNRVKALERRFGGLIGPAKRDLRIVYQFDGDPEPEERPNESLFVIRVVNTKNTSFEFKSEANKQTNDETDDSQLIERERAAK